MAEIKPAEMGLVQAELSPETDPAIGIVGQAAALIDGKESLWVVNATEATLAVYSSGPARPAC